MHKRNIKQIEQVLLSNTYVYTYSYNHVITNNKNGYGFKESKEKYIGNFGERKVKKETKLLSQIL